MATSPPAASDTPPPHLRVSTRPIDAGAWKTVDVTRAAPSWISAAGDMISTTRDLHTFFSALMGGRLLPAPLPAEMRTPHPKLGYGLGLLVQEAESGGTVYTHNGGMWGWGR